MSESRPPTGADRPLLRRADEIDYDPIEAAPGLRKGVLLSEEHGMPNFALRRFTLEAGATVPRHTNAVEHEQYVLEGGYVVGIDDEEFAVETGDVCYVPAGAPHWYRNDSDHQGSFICAVPNGDDSIELLE